jgi:hypothetical protein
MTKFNLEERLKQRGDKPWPKYVVWYRFLFATCLVYSFAQGGIWLQKYRRDKKVRKYLNETPETDFEGVYTQRLLGQYNRPIASQGIAIFKPYYYQYNKMHDVEDIHYRFELLSMRQKLSDLKKKTQ